MTLLKNISSFVKDSRVEESLSSIIMQKIKTDKSVRAIPKNYFYVTHLINPAKFYWEQKHSDVEKTDGVNRKLVLGKKLEKIANYWFRSLPSFYLEEGVLDGAWVDIPGVRGSIDYRIGDSIVEFKTKENIPETGEEIFQKYPQDLEQVAFYAILHPDIPKENFLVFMTNTKPYQIRAFRVKILDHGRIKTLLLSRMSLLRKAIETNDPANLGRCRYYEGGCEYNEHKICKCSEQEPLSIESLKKSLEVSIDDEFTMQLDQAKKGKADMETYFSTRDVIAPRKYYLASKGLGTDDAWKADSKREGHLAILGSVIRKLSLSPSIEEFREINSQLKEKRLKLSPRWIKLKSSGKENGEIVPYITKVGLANDKKQIIRPGDYHLTELAIICSAYGKSRGIIFIIYPELEDTIRAYEVTFNNANGVLKYTRAALDNLEKALKNDDLSLIQACPEFMNDGGKCPLIEKCNGEGLRGCSQVAVAKQG